MREFRDDQGRPWQVALTCNTAMRVRDNVKITVDGKEQPFDIVDVGAMAQTMQVLRGGYMTIAETLYAILQSQVEERKLTREQFLDGLRGDALEAGAKVLEEELVDFFPARLRRVVGLLAARMDEAATEVMRQAEEEISRSGTQSGEPPASSESIPATGHSASSVSPATRGSRRTGGTPQSSSA